MQHFWLKKRNKKSRKILLCILLGALTGTANGFFGGGGGMICVPLLCFVLGLLDKKAHATAIFIILPLCLVSAGVYVFKGIYDINSTIWVGVGTIFGGILGAIFLKKISNTTIRIIFSIVMCIAGLKMII